MRVTLIGTGRLGTNLHAALCRAGHEVVWLRGRDVTGATCPQEEAWKESDIVIICVRDDAIAQVAQAVTARRTDGGLLVVHTAGSVPMDVLPHPRRGVFYPMQTFSKERLVDFAEIPVFTEAATEEDARLLELLAKSISRYTYPIDSKQRKFLHLAAVFACNFVNHCYALSANILQSHGIPFDAMLPLINETASKVNALPPHEAQTGPAARHDRDVMARQEALLEGRMKEIYRLMSQSIWETAQS